MEQQSPPKKSVAVSPSFRLRNQSLNTLRLRRVFDLFDRDSDGQLTLSELNLALSRLGIGSDNSSSDLSALISPYIQPENSGLHFDDFLSLHRELGDSLFGGVEGPDLEGESETESDMVEAFRVFDVDGDGFISARELQAVLGKLGLAEGESIERVNQMILSVDCNKDGRVDFGEFKDMMRMVSV